MYAVQFLLFGESGRLNLMSSFSPAFPFPIQGKISSDFDVLEVLSADRPWIPNRHTCRPHPDVLERKNALFEDIATNWRSFLDQVCVSVFGCSQLVGVDGKLESCRSIEGKIIFEPCLFPYQIRHGMHYVLWYGMLGGRGSLSDTQISSDIRSKIIEIVGDTVAFDYAWYENPKPSIPEVFHVQVFWSYEDL